MTESKSSSFMRATSPSRVMPALFTSTSSRPNAVCADSTSVVASSALATLATSAIDFTPYFMVSSQASSWVCGRLAALEQFRHTFMPSLASFSAMARPIPRLDPVTSAPLRAGFASSVMVSLPCMSSRSGLIAAARAVLGSLLLAVY